MTCCPLQTLLQCLKLTEELETVKAQMDERGTSMTDSGWPFLLLTCQASLNLH